jgi:hypothetical protein
MLSEVFECLQDSLEEIRLTSMSLGKNISLDPAIQVCVEMQHLRSLALSSAPQKYTASGTPTTHPPQPSQQRRNIISKEVLLELCQSSTTLQDLALRAMDINDDTCQTIADALITNSFLTSLDIRQNPLVGNDGYKAILSSLERNYDLWCSVMVVSTGRRVVGLFLKFAFFCLTDNIYTIIIFFSLSLSLSFVRSG